MQAGVYASVIHYLKAVDKVGGAADGKAVVAAMRRYPPTIRCSERAPFGPTDENPSALSA